MSPSSAHEELTMAKSKPKSPTGNMKEGVKKVARGVTDAAKKAVGQPRKASVKK
jgi:hypothetical protein